MLSSVLIVSQRNSGSVERTFLTVEFINFDKAMTGPGPQSVYRNLVIGRLFKEIESRFFEIDIRPVTVGVALGLLTLVLS